MGWTAPRTWTTGELVTAAFMNTHVRDNLAYLKGQAGTVAFEDAATFAGLVTVSLSSAPQLTLDNTGGAVNSYHGVTAASAAIWDVNRNNQSGTFDDTAKSHARVKLDGAGTTSFVTIETANAANTTASERVRVDGAGKVGIGITAPLGRLHLVDSISGFIKYEFDGLDGTARTLVADGTGDVIYEFHAWGLVRSSGGTISRFSTLGGTGVAPSGSTNIYSSGGDTVALAVSAAGAVTVQRTGGTLTYKVCLMGTWL